jgi:ribonuclease HI
MSVSSPHYLLFSQSSEPSRSAHGASAAGWRFILEEVDGDQRLVAQDVEPHTPVNRLELLAVVRGLEALDRPSRVTLITGSRYVSRGIRQGLAEWRRHHWRWERFGRWVPVRDHDLWRRVDQALRFHQLNCRSWHVEHDDRADRRPPARMAATAGAA